jgi:hypothetical protein
MSVVFVLLQQEHELKRDRSWSYSCQREVDGHLMASGINWA